MSKHSELDLWNKETRASILARYVIPTTEQTRLESLVEAFINVLIGFWISFIANAIVLPLVGLPVSIGQNLLIGFFMTFVSVGRQYIIRRWAQAHLRTARVKLAAYLRGVLNG